MSTDATAIAGELAALPPAPEPPRRPVLVVGTLLVVAAGTVLIGALLAGYFSARDLARADGVPWPPEEAIFANVPLFVGYLTLLMSSFTAQWAVTALTGRDRRQMYVAIALTLVLGLAFVNALSFALHQLGVAAESSSFATTVFAVNATHLILVVTAHVGFVVMGFRALGGQFSPNDRQLVVAIATYWHFCVAAGLVIWYAIWFLEGGP
ncbi:MAG TPA: cytochrome c oxidase subunit 3 [Acidimicrobiales bacterium]|nr:cytochrome c oxidase subunit 3 [Acidimicrobiales bacterium]